LTSPFVGASCRGQSNRSEREFGHQPRFSSGEFGSVKIYGAFWRLLYQYHADVVLNGHDHVYERFAPQTPKAIPSQSGIREFVVGTGGVGHQTFTTIAPNSEVRDDSSFGVLDLTLHPTSYSWNFVSASPSTFSDTGDSPCVA